MNNQQLRDALAAIHDQITAAAASTPKQVIADADQLAAAMAAIEDLQAQLDDTEDTEASPPP